MSDTTERRLLDDARAAALEHLGAGATLDGVMVLARRPDGRAETLHFWADAGGAVRARRRTVPARVLEVLRREGGAVERKRLARLAGCRYNSYFRGHCRRLIDAGLARDEGEGLAATEPPLFRGPRLAQAGDEAG